VAPQEQFQLGDQLKHHYELGLGGAMSFIMMSKSAYNGLSADARGVLDAHSTCEYSRQFGAYLDRESADQRQLLIDRGGHTFVESTPERLASLRKRFEGDFKQKFADNLPLGEPLVDAFYKALDDSK